MEKSLRYGAVLHIYHKNKEDNMKHFFLSGIGPKLHKYYVIIITVVIIALFVTPAALAVDNMWVLADVIIKDVYGKLAGISTALAGLMSAVAVVGAKLSNNQHKVDQAWDWLKRIWIAWAVINGIGAFIAYILPIFNGLATIS